MRAPERAEVWEQGYRQGVEAGFQLATRTVEVQIRRQELALGREPWHGADLALTATGPAWLPGDSLERAASKP